MERVNRRGRKLLLSRPLVVLCWAALLAGISDIALYQSGLTLQNPYTRPERTSALEAWRDLGSQKSNVIFVGDSHTGHTFIPALVDAEATLFDVTSFNVSAPASTLPSDAGTIDYIIARGARPRLLVWGVGKRQTSLLDFGGFQRNEATLGIAVDIARHVPTWSNLCTLGFCAMGGFRALLQVPFTLLPQYRRELENTRRIRGMGWAQEVDEWSRAHNHSLMPNAPSTPTEWAQSIWDIPNDRYVKTPFCDEPTVRDALQFGLHRARQSGIPTMIVNVPLTRARTAVEKDYGYDRYVSWLRNICRKEKVTFIDLNQPPLLPPDADFADTHHLSARGAERLSRRFTREFIVPALKASPKEAQP